MKRSGKEWGRQGKRKKERNKWRWGMKKETKILNEERKWEGERKKKNEERKTKE